ncbi:MAG: hypothetical protein IPM34_06760 [Saprospiraceae bacterium]|nr:hypothetical protein [Saprospiraceae bacterium]
MDFNSILIAVLLVSIILLPFLLSRRSRKKREKKFKLQIEELAGQFHCELHTSEICGDYIIGYDERKKFIFFVNLKDLEYQKQAVNLADVADCKIIKSFREASTGNPGFKVPVRLELTFIPKQKGLEEIRFEFYNFDRSPQLSGELQSIEHWASFLHSKLG